jgi:hypothetical protein
MLIITLEDLADKVRIAKNKTKMMRLKNLYTTSKIENARMVKALPVTTREEMLERRLYAGIYDGDNQPTVTPEELAFEYQLNIDTTKTLIDADREEREMELLYGSINELEYRLNK